MSTNTGLWSVETLRDELVRVTEQRDKARRELADALMTLAEEVCRKLDETKRADQAEAALTPYRHELWIAHEAIRAFLDDCSDTGTIRKAAMERLRSTLVR